MKRLPFILLFLTAIVLAIATFVEDRNGTDFSHTAVYGALWFKMLWGAVAVSAVWWICKAKLYRRTAVFMLHLSLMLILSGGLVTALTYKGGMLHLRQGCPEAQFVADDHHVEALPFVISLDTFYIQYYPGIETPQDYVSRVDIGGATTHVISMNRILRQDGFRLYQHSYDPDGLGSWLTVTYDPYGTAIAYIGFLLFGLSGIVMLFGRRNGFWQLCRQFRTSGTISLLLILFIPLSVTAMGACSCSDSTAEPSSTVAKDTEVREVTIPSIARVEADSLAPRLVIWNGRVCPFNTLATDFVVKVYGKRRCMSYSPEQVVASWSCYPDIWNRAPVIEVKNVELRQRIGMNDTHCSYVSLFDSEGNYRLQPLWENLADKHGKLAQAIQQVDEKVALITMLQNGSLIREVGEGGGGSTAEPSSTVRRRIKAELLYNRVPFVSILFMVNLSLAALCFILLCLPRLRPMLSSFWWRLLLVLSLLTLLFAYVLRWYVSGRVPLSNGFETMMFAALAIQAIALVLCRRWPLVIPFGFVLSGFLLLVAHLGVMSPQITNLMPVLQSPWLSSHVSVIMIAYALLGFTFLNSLFALIMSRRENRRAQDGGEEEPRREKPRALEGEALTLLSRLMLYPAVFLLFVGIFLGAVWANVSWGTYWSWDPKEVWALITAIVYALPLHGQSLEWVRNNRTFNRYLIFAFLTVLMTYFGVNFLLSGMHSYAS